MSVNIDDRILNINDKHINEIESLYELIVIGVFGDDFALPDTNELSEDKANIVSYMDTSQTPTIPTFHLPEQHQSHFKTNAIDVENIIDEITPPPPKC